MYVAQDRVMEDNRMVIIINNIGCLSSNKSLGPPLRPTARSTSGTTTSTRCWVLLRITTISP